MQFTNSNYYHAMDQLSSQQVIEPLLSEDEKAVKEAMTLGTAELGTTTNPMGNTVESVKSRIMEGAGRLEFEFIGSGKGSSQSPTPESFGSKERQDMKELLTINDIKSSVHAAVHMQSLAGFNFRNPREGFSGQQREEALREIKRAINFAGDVTDGGAIVFHFSEWSRPLTYAGKRDEKRWMFKGYDTEEHDAEVLVVDNRTGDTVAGVSKDIRVYEPKYLTVADRNPELIGKIVDGRKVLADDWINVKGGIIPKDETNVNALFNRVPDWNAAETNFYINELRWEDFVKRAEEHNKAHPDSPVTPEVLFARTRLENDVLQAKGNSLYYAMRYGDLQKQQKKLRQALELYEAYEGDLPSDVRDQLKDAIQTAGKFTTPDYELPSEQIKDSLKYVEDQMRHIHESSAAADARAKEQLSLIQNLRSAEEYGLQKSAESIAKIGLMAREETVRKGLKNPLYAAPENYDQHMYGSHPLEMRKLVEKSREEMARQLMKEKKAGSMEQGLDIAKKHIRATLDIGHMNLWRQYFDPVNEKGESVYKTAEDREKAFEKWMLEETEKLVKDGIVGHVHLTDNYGYGDEHLTPGQGSVPMKEFLKRMEKAGLKDMIVEPGSYNITSSFFDTLSLVGSPVYGVGRLPRFNQMQHAHFGYNAPPFFIAGAYAPSNDWRPWTEVPLE